jgi:hypothetical protein
VQPGSVDERRPPRAAQEMAGAVDLIGDSGRMGDPRAKVSKESVR